ncbi:MAG: HD domain-containing protein, partial [Burkholderiales bacterium]|nr:HD domain-containing protein [Burkholderiales bacterium]
MLIDDALIDSLIHEGLFAHQPPSGTAGAGNNDIPTIAAEEVESVLHLINHCNSELEKLLPALSATDNPGRLVRSLARQLQTAIDVQRDIALASIYLNQIAGVYAVRHCTETAIIALIIAKGYGLPPDQCESIACAALTMNVGMLDFHEQLQSRHTQLSHEEKRAIQRHPEQSVALLQNAGIVDVQWLDCVLHHHEAEDGTGYPYGLEETQVPFNARLLGMCDRYCAQVSARNYRKSLRPNMALQALQSDNKQDSEIWQIFAKEIGPYPPGTYVKLTNGETAIVCHQSVGITQAHALLDSSEHSIISKNLVRDCQDEHFQIQQSLHEDEIDIRFGMKQVWGALAAI